MNFNLSDIFNFPYSIHHVRFYNPFAISRVGILHFATSGSASEPVSHRRTIGAAFLEIQLKQKEREYFEEPSSLSFRAPKI